MLIKVSVIVNFGNEYEILFIILCEKGYIFMVEELIKVGVDVNLVKYCKMFFIFVCVNK